MKINIYTIAYNEEVMLPHFIRHYRERFPDCKITIFNNESTDNTVDIAIKNNCEVISYSTNNQLSDERYLEIKNNCWKEHNGWAIVCDCDELLDINEAWLLEEESQGTTFIITEGYNMVNMEDHIDIPRMYKGIRDTNYDKICMFNTRAIEEINYDPGCHSCNPKGILHPSARIYTLFHYKFIGEEYLVQRYKTYASRLSETNLKYGWGSHYQQEENSIREQFRNVRKHPNLVTIR